MKTIKPTFAITILLISSAWFSTVTAAEVRSISREIVQKINGKSSLKVKVTCAEVSEARVILQQKRSGPWCSADLPSACAKQKIKAAAKVCGTHFQNAINEYQVKQQNAHADKVAGETKSQTGIATEVQIASVAVPLASKSDKSDSGDAPQQDSDLEKRYEEYVENIEF